MKGNYNTKQRGLILSILEKENGHITAARLAEKLHENGERTGLATVYRQLDKLVELGIVRKYITDKVACYQYVQDGCEGHFHLQCTECGTLFHVDCHFLSGLAPHILKHHGFTVDNRRTVMYGKCEKCTQAESGGNKDNG